MIHLIQAPRLVQSIGCAIGALIFGLTGMVSAGAPTDTELQINTSTQGSQHQPTMARNASGQTIVVWKQDGQKGSSPALMAQRYDPTGASVGSESILYQASTNDINRPAVAIDQHGMVLAVWEGQSTTGEGRDIFSQRFDSSNRPMGPVARVNSTTTGHQRHAAIAVGPDRQSIILWETTPENRDDTDIVGQRYGVNGIPVGNEFQVNTTTEGYQTDPVAVIDHQGNIFVVWRGETPNGRGLALYGQRYDANGKQLGREFLVNTEQTPVRMAAGMAMNDDGHIAVMWPTDNPKTSQLRLVAQYFDLARNATGVPDFTEFPWQLSYGQMVRELAWESETPALSVWARFDEATQWDIKGAWSFGNDHP